MCLIFFFRFFFVLGHCIIQKCFRPQNSRSMHESFSRKKVKVECIRIWLLFKFKFFYCIKKCLLSTYLHKYIFYYPGPDSLSQVQSFVSRRHGGLVLATKITDGPPCHTVSFFYCHSSIYLSTLGCPLSRVSKEAVYQHDLKKVEKQ